MMSALPTPLQTAKELGGKFLLAAAVSLVCMVAMVGTVFGLAYMCGFALRAFLAGAGMRPW